MRRSRWLYLAAIICIIVALGAVYSKQKRNLAKDAPMPPRPLETGIDARLNGWCYTKNDGSTPRVSICAERFRQVKEPSVMELEGVELKLFHKSGAEFDLVKSAKALCDTTAKTLFSDGPVEITMGVPVDGPKHGRIVKIHSSGVSFQTETGNATTDRIATFEFDQGGGSAIGAEYDPQTRELHLRSQVSLDWRGKSPDAKPMHIESGEALYRERESKIILTPWSKLTRDTLHIEGKMSVVTLKDGEVRLAEVEAARGARDDSDRKVEFAADQMEMNFADHMVVSQIHGDRNARLVSTSSSARTTVTANRLDLGFETSEKESTLSTALAMGNSVAETVPLTKPGAVPPETKVLHSEVIHMKMRSGGQEIESVETDGAATLDFLPNSAGQPKRFLKGDKIWIAYGAENRIRDFRSVNVSTRTEKPAEKGKPAPPPAFTSSKEMFAAFDPKTSEIARLDQKTDFKYDQGDRHARAAHAMLEQQKDLMNLDGSARVWDSTGSASADRIVMNQKSGDFTADGNVASTRMPDPKGHSSAMLSTDEIMQARAKRMVSTGDNLKIHYEGNAMAWQGSNRVEADTLDIDRDAEVMEAHGKVISQFVDKDKSKPAGDKSKAGDKAKTKGKSKTAAAPIFTVVRSADLVYTEETRVAVYQGGAVLKRPDLTVSGKEIKAFLKDADADSSLDKAFADGDVKIVSTAHKKTRTGTSEHAEYYAGEEKVILMGGEPLLVDSVSGKTQGNQLTWWANDDRLLVNGVMNQPAKSTIRKKK